MSGEGRLLLTGATGFLGGAIAAALLDGARWRDLLVLIRAKDAAEGKARLAECMQRFALEPRLVERIADEQILCGDLCGAALFAHDPRLAEITEVVNCAAFASFSNHPQIGPVAQDQFQKGKAKRIARRAAAAAAKRA